MPRKDGLPPLHTLEFGVTHSDDDMAAFFARVEYEQETEQMRNMARELSLLLNRFVGDKTTVGAVVGVLMRRAGFLVATATWHDEDETCEIAQKFGEYHHAIAHGCVAEFRKHMGIPDDAVIHATVKGQQ